MKKDKKNSTAVHTTNNQVSDRNDNEKSKKTLSKKKKLIIISAVSAVILIIAAIITVGTVLYFNSPAFAAAKLYDAVKNKDGKTFGEMILPSDKQYIDSILSPLEMKTEDTAEMLGDVIASYEGGEIPGISYSRNGDTAIYSIDLTKEIGTKIDVPFKKADGKWYLAPASIVDRFPIKAGIDLIEAVKAEDGEAFFECLVPSESRTINLLLGLFLTKDRILQMFLESADITFEDGELPSIDSFKLKGEEASVVLKIEGKENVTLIFKNKEGKWYLSVSKILTEFFKK